MIHEGDILDGIYEIIREIGHGGTGIIYLARHLRLQKLVVLKKIKENYTGQVNVRGEVDILKRLHHTYLPQVYDFRQIGSTVYTVMDYIEGHDLQYYLDQGCRFPEKTVLLWLTQLSEVLHYLHTQTPAILHSDIKPSNIMITPEGNVCLIDFNISLDGEFSKDIQGISPWYCAPEQHQKVRDRLYGGRDRIVLDGRMDIYSLGAVFYTVLTGCLPGPEEEQFVPIIYMDIPYSDGLKSVIYKAMQKMPSRRFQNAGQMRQALADVSRLDPKFRSLTRYQYAVAAVYGLCLILGILFLYYGSSLKRKEDWQADYQVFYEANTDQEEDKIISLGMDILNETRYRSFYKDHEKEKAGILHAIGDSYFRQEDFAQAVKYYEEASEIEASDNNYRRDHIVALVRNHETDRAKEILMDMPQFSQPDFLLIQAELEVENEEWDQAEGTIRDLLTMDLSREEQARAALLGAYICQKQHDIDGQVVMLRKARQAKETIDVLRRLGQACAGAAKDSDKEVEQHGYLREALECYQILCSLKSPSYEDRLNLAFMLNQNGDYEKSLVVLKSLKNEYQEDYKIGMWMCYNYLDQAKAAGNLASVEQDLNFYYQECKRLYDRNKKETDENMEQLIQIMGQLM